MSTERKRLTVSLPAAEWDAIFNEAEAKGQTIGTYAAALLKDRNMSPGARAARAVNAKNKRDFESAVEHLAKQGVTVDHLKAQGCKTKADVLQWARLNAGWQA